jgi:hypothetical protein
MLRSSIDKISNEDDDEGKVVTFPKAAIAGKETGEDYLTPMENDTHFVCYLQSHSDPVFLSHFKKDYMADGIVFVTEFMYDSTTHNMPVLPVNFCRRYKLERIITVDSDGTL